MYQQNKQFSGIHAARFFAARDAIDPARGCARVVGEDVRHIRDVLRKKEGDAIILCDGGGWDYACVIAGFTKDAVDLRITGKQPSGGEPSVRVTLYQCLPKSDKMDWIIQKCIEAGVSAIIPIISERTQFGGERTRKMNSSDPDMADTQKHTRWRRIALEAAKQSGRGIVPAVGALTDFESAMIRGTGNGASSPVRSLIPYEECRDYTLKKAIAAACRDGVTDVNIFIGPEGGFTPQEISRAQAHGITPVTLGPRILRTETAGLAVVSAIMYEYET